MKRPLAEWVLERLAEGGRSLEYVLPDGTTVPFDDAELLVELLQGILVADLVSASATLSASAGMQLSEEKHSRAGRPLTVRERVIRQARARMEAGESLDFLETEKQHVKEATYGCHYLTADRALAQIRREIQQVIGVCATN